MCGRTQNGISCLIVNDESLECLALSNAARASLVLEMFLRASSLVSWAECPKKSTILRWLICRSRKRFLLMHRHVDQAVTKLLLSDFRVF